MLNTADATSLFAVTIKGHIGKGIDEIVVKPAEGKSPTYEDWVRLENAIHAIKAQ